MAEPRFLVSLGEVELDVAEVWPDGGAPANPTAADVVKAMEDAGGLRRVAQEWNLVTEITVFGLRDRSWAALR